MRRPSEVASAAREAARLVSGGKLVGFATETVYGIAALASNAETMERLRDLKARPARPFSVHVGRPADVARYVKDVPPHAREIIAKAWPGPITLLLGVGGRLADPALQKAGLYGVLCSDDAIGLRCPDEPVAIAMLSAVDGPVVAPSANLAGQPSPRSAEDVLNALDGKIDLLIDSGPTRYGKDSTIVSFVIASAQHGQTQPGKTQPAKAVLPTVLPEDDWAIVRKGVMDERAIRRLLRHKILFVCAGNTCRSPMAVGLARKFLAEKLDCGQADLKKHGYEVSSAGLWARSGGRATPEAIMAARRHGADISRHRSRELTSELIADADVIFCMTSSQVEQARALNPGQAHKIRRLDNHGDISDPVGGGVGVYNHTAERIMRVLKSLWDEGIL